MHLAQKLGQNIPDMVTAIFMLVTPSRLNHSTVCNVMKPPFNGATYLIKTELNVTSVGQKNTNQKRFDVYMYFDFLVCSIC